ncbi:MAG: hypothetical protein ACHQF3_00475 [Alphaproteobacteria bacterium]
MRQAVLALITVLCLTGCVAQNINDGLNGLMGQNIQAAVARLGYPDAQRTMLGDTIYVWSSNHSAALPVTSTNTTVGTVGTMPVYGTTTSTEWVPVNYNCTIQIATDADGTMKHYQWSGNMGGCASYARALKP